MYNMRRRGLTELLISVERQCEGPVSEISGGKFTPTPFLFPQLLYKLAEAGRAGRQNSVIMNKKDLSASIGTFVERCYKSPKRVELPSQVFEIRGISDVKINEDSLKEVTPGGKLWTFTGTAIVSNTDGVTEVQVDSNRKIIGSAVVNSTKDDGSRNVVEIKQVIITKIEKYEKQIF